MSALPKPVDNEVLVFTSTPNEYRSVSYSVAQESFGKLACSVIDSGPGRIHATYSVASRLARFKGGQGKPRVIIGTGTSGSLSLSMKQGDVIVSNGAIISDWRMEEGDQVKVSPYGVFDYRELNPSHLAKMVLECHDPLVVSLLERLPEGEFKKGHLLTSEAFVSGKDHKLGLGAAFNCLACDMESGAYAYVGNCLAKVPWLNVRVVADTLEDTLGDYFEKERNMTDILGQKIVKVLRIIDSLT